MKHLSSVLLAIGLAGTSSVALAQSGYDRYGNGYYGNTSQASHYDYARVIRVDPVLDGRYSRTNNYGNYGQQRCYETTTAGSYERDGYYRNDGYYQNDGYNDPYGRSYGGSNAGRNVATIFIGKIVRSPDQNRVAICSNRVARQPNHATHPSKWTMRRILLMA